MKLKNPMIVNELRKFYFDNKWSHHEVIDYLQNHYDLAVSLRTLKRWRKSLSNPTWTGPIAPSPPPPVAKVQQEEILRICTLRKKTGWGALPLKHIFKFEVSESTYKRIIKANGLSRGSKIENKRIHWVKWQRQHPDSLWQLDAHQDEQGNWLMPVIDDCSRYCLGIREMNSLTTQEVTSYLEDLFKIHGVPRELLSDNGAEFGNKSKNSEFDQWCEKFGIKHIRPHRSLFMKTPAEVYFDLQQRLKPSKELEKDRW